MFVTAEQIILGSHCNRTSSYYAFFAHILQCLGLVLICILNLEVEQDLFEITENGGKEMKIPYTIKNYWTNVGVSFLIAMLSNMVIGQLVGTEIARFVYLVLLVYWIIIEIRRFHDANKSGWLALINLIPGVGTFATLIIAGVLQSKYQNNRWL